jgi:hypothetical protein
MKTAVMHSRGVPPEAPKGYRRQSTDCMARRSRNQRWWGEPPSSLLLRRVELSDSGGSTEARPTVHKSSRAGILQDSNTKRLKAAANREALAELIAASLASTPHLGRREWRNRPRRGRRLAVEDRLFSPPIIWVCFSKQTHMMAAAKLEKRRFPQETGCFDVQGEENQKAFFRKQTQMNGDSDHGMTRFELALCPAAAGYGVETAREPWERGHPARQRLRRQMRSASSWLRRFACAGHAPRLGGRAGCPRSQTDAPQCGLKGKRFPLPIRWEEGEGDGLRRLHGYGQVNPTRSDSIRLKPTV